MSSTFETPRTPQGPLSIEDVRQFLFAEARSLDDKDWDAWLAFYAPDAEFWMPSWDDELEDRVFRIRTERSSATSLPEPRTSHNISNVEIIEQTCEECRLRFNWVTFSFRYKTVDTYFGTSFYTLAANAARPVVKSKKVILKNDYIHHVIDIYHI
jgi:benzoate/toluate 1,2-dioxygenase beta subunit